MNFLFYILAIVCFLVSTVAEEKFGFSVVALGLGFFALGHITAGIA